MDMYEEIAKLKQILRKGWKIRNVSHNSRVESDAEHCYSMSMLALEIMSKENLNLDQAKVLKMVNYHEIGEIDFGDHTPFDNVSMEEKYANEYNCVKRIAESYNMPEMLTIWQEYQEGISPESQFVRKIDKLDAIKQAKIYSKLTGNDSLYKEFYNFYPHIVDEFEKYL